MHKELEMTKHERQFELGSMQFLISSVLHLLTYTHILLGQYESLINGNNWCVVDFCATSKQVRQKPYAHTYYVSFSTDKKSFKIWDLQGCKRAFTVISDKVCLKV